MKTRTTITGRYMARLRGLAVGKSLRLSASDGRYERRAIWRHAANKLRQRVSIKATPDAVCLWRIA